MKASKENQEDLLLVLVILLRFSLSLPGIDLAALREMRPFEQLKAVADSLNKVQDLNQRLYLMTKIFEESGPKFQQLFATGEGDRGISARLLEDLGLSLSKEDIAKFRELNWLSIQLSRSWKALSRDALIEVSPSLIQFRKNGFKRITKCHDKGFRGKVTEAFVNLFTALGTLFMNFLNSYLRTCW